MLSFVVTGPCTHEEPYSGSCDTQSSQLYYYHASQDRCLPYEGCPANNNTDNSYNSLQTCRQTCMGEWGSLLIGCAC